MQMPLKLGDQIPDFSLSDQLGVSRTNKQAKGRPLVLFFYPKDDTPGCTAENCGFRDKYDLFKLFGACLLYTSPSPRDRTRSRMPSSA